MASGASVKKTWYGDILRAKVDRAMGRSIIGIGEVVVVDAKRNAHVVSGTLVRSVHSAPVDWPHDNDLAAAQSQDLPNVGPASREGVKRVIMVGSWLPYACVEEVGRGHQFITPAVESVRGVQADGIVREAMAQEGMLGVK